MRYLQITVRSATDSYQQTAADLNELQHLFGTRSNYFPTDKGYNVEHWAAPLITIEAVWTCS